MLLHISRYPCGTTIYYQEQTEAICSKGMRRLASVSVYYMLGERYILYGITRSRIVLLEHNMKDACFLALVM